MMLILILTSLFILRCLCKNNCTNIPYNETNNIPYTELKALCDLYEATNGIFWSWKSDSYGVKWNFTNPSPCIDYWQGISCDLTTQYKFTVVNLTLVSYHLNGSVPNSIGDLSNLTSLTLDTNNLTSSIPSSIGYIKNLTKISMNQNQLTNTIPNSIQNLKHLEYLELWDNYLIGTFPSFLCDLLELRAIFIPFNQIHGELPNCLGNLIEIRAFVVEYNDLTGTIPASLGSLNKMFFLDLNYNYFDSSIPDSIGNIENLKYLNLYHNILTGNIPSSFKNLKKMENCLLSNNLLSGTFPIEFSHLNKLNYLYAASNLITGRLPDIISSFINIDTLILGDNYFTGSIPNTITNFKRITTLYLGQNHFSGTIPISIGNLTTLYNLDFQKNSLIGKLPESMSQMKSLTSLNLLNNKLSGSLKHIFNASIQESLSTIQLSHNQFTGTIPKEIFKLNNLASLSLESNCFEASLPVELCQSHKLTTVDLNGLHTATDCQYLLLPGLSESYVSLGYVIDPSIPHCYFNMPGLSVLHLSGNSLTGKIPSRIHENLTDLTISYNSLSGSIPKVIQERKWVNLDLSHNKLNGLLHSNFAKQDESSSINLEVNRLSGEIPKHLLNMKNISILNGNVFSCTTFNDLPKHDDNKYTYECGSNSFNTPYLIFTIILGLIIFLVVIIIKLRNQIEKYINVEYLMERFSLWYHFNEQFSELIENRLQTYKKWCEFSNIILRITLYSSMFIIFILSVAYVILAQFYETLHYSYAWTVSLAFSSGVTSGSIELVLLILFIFYIIILFQWFIYKYSSNEVVIKTNESAKTNKSILSSVEPTDTSPSSTVQISEKSTKYLIILEKIKIYGIYMLINFSITLGVNIAYIYAVFYANPYIIALSRLLLSIFKLFWSGVCCPVLVTWCIYYLSKVNINGRRTEFFMIQLFVGLTNSITIPCITVAVISPNCFYNFFAKLNSIDSVYYYIFRYKQYFGSTTYVISDITIKGSTSYDPPFVYGYQCASSIITSYSPAFVYLCILAAFINPIGQILLQQVHHRIRKTTYLNKIICSILPRTLMDIDDEDVNNMHSNLKPITNARQATINLITFLGILLTFGAAFPPLAFALLVTIFIMMNFTYLKISRFLYNVVQSNYLNYLDIIDLECYGTVSGELLKRSQWMLAGFCSCFYSLFIFDTFGDEVGGSALWILIVLPITPICIYQMRQLSYYMHNRYYQMKSIEVVTNINTDVEMTSDKADHPTQVFFNPMVVNNDKAIDS